MAELAVALWLVYLALAFVLRIAVQVRRTGSTGFKGIGGADARERLGGVVFALAVPLSAAAPVLDLEGTLDPIAAVDGPVGHAAGAVLAISGIGLTLYAQLAMGASWRIGVDEAERTDLVTGGPFALVRNPIYAAMLPAVLGLTLLVPNAVAVAGFALLVLGLELQTRVVEEPHLIRTHGDEYRAYAARVGRFVPGVGRLPWPS